MKKTHYICPICHSELNVSDNGKSLLCAKEEKPHCYDISSAGYVNLDRGHSGGGDSKDCVRSRTAFLSLGHYSPISDKINALALEFCGDSPIILDAGCGEGYYTSALAKKAGTAEIIGIDISKPAVEHAAKNVANVKATTKNSFLDFFISKFLQAQYFKQPCH